MKKLLFFILSCGLSALLMAQTTGPIQIRVDASKQIATVTKCFNGTNIEDLNNQTNGGIFSQLIHGEAFEENIDIDFLGLPLGDYVKVYVILDENRRPHFLSQANIYTRVNWNNLSEKYDFNSKDIYDAVVQAAQPRPSRDGGPPMVRPPLQIGDLRFYSRFVLFDSIPEATRKIMLKRINGDEQISRYWSKITSGNAKGKYVLRRGDAYMGRQNQVIRMQEGNGEFGLYNAGLNKQGIYFEKGKPYEGILRIRAHQPVTLYLSLRDENGQILAEEPYYLKGNGSFEKVEFELIPKGETTAGRFGIALKEKGQIELGYAFLQPGYWGRVRGYPVRKGFADALMKQGIKTIRYNGSMVDVGADTYLYRWKKMIGPVDERRVCFRSGFNPYATHSFGVVELCQVAESIGAKAMVGLSMVETYEDIRDFVEYMNGPVDSRWGRLRAEHGHPEPYNLKYIEVDNERHLTRGYAECMKKFARAAWEADPEMHIVASLNIGTNPSRYARGTEEYALASELFGWFIEQGQADKMVWDPHYSGALFFADHPGFTHSMGIDLQNELARDYPGYKLTLCPMEENGSRCDWDRGLAHAHNWNTLQRYGDHFTWLGSANTFQPHGQHYMWDQGRVHYTSSEIWFQPSAHIDAKMTEDWLPIVVKATSSNDSLLDVTAKINQNRDSLSLYVANLSNEPREAIIQVKGFRLKGRAEIWMIGDCELTEYNPVDHKNNVAPVSKQISFSRNDAAYTFPRYSYTIITLKR